MLKENWARVWTPPTTPCAHSSKQPLVTSRPWHMPHAKQKGPCYYLERFITHNPQLSLVYLQLEIATPTRPIVVKKGWTKCERLHLVLFSRSQHIPRLEFAAEATCHWQRRENQPFKRSQMGLPLQDPTTPRSKTQPDLP